LGKYGLEGHKFFGIKFLKDLQKYSNMILQYQKSIII